MATISRLYKHYDTGARVVAELEHFGISHTDISIIANNDTGWFDRNRSTRIDRDADGTDDRAEGAAAGAGIGATIGGVAGLLAGLGLLAIPGIGPVVAAGWLASTAAVAAAGGATGGLIGALTQSGIGEPEARNYAEGVRRGGTLVTVRVRDTDRMQVEAIMDRHNPTRRELPQRIKPSIGRATALWRPLKMLTGRAPPARPWPQRASIMPISSCWKTAAISITGRP
jgi:hypothetical protein